MNKWILRLLGLVVPVISPALKTDLATLLDQLEASAKKTANPYDDILVGLLKSVMLGD